MIITDVEGDIIRTAVGLSKSEVATLSRLVLKRVRDIPPETAKELKNALRDFNANKKRFSTIEDELLS